MKNLNQTFIYMLMMSFCFIACETTEFGEPETLVPLTVIDDATLPSVMINGSLLHSEAFGNPTDPMIVTIHGGPGVDYRSILNFKDLADDGYYVVFYDQRGSGLSERHDEEHYHDKKVQFFIYSDQFLTGSDHEVLDYKMSLFLPGQDTGDATPPPFWRLGSVLSNWAQTYAPDHPEEMDFTANLSSYQTEVLFAYSENNVHYGREHALLVSGAYPNVQLQEVKACGHEIIHFGWDEFYPIVKAYLN